MVDSGLLLDTNALIWIATDSSHLTPAAIEALSDSSLRLLVSPLSTNEMALKISKGKLTFGISVGEWIGLLMAELRATSLPLTHEHAARIEHLPWHHKDPFDRLLIAQALVEDVPIISSDRVFDVYGVTRIW